jgi:predicted ABC-type ATPase
MIYTTRLNECLDNLENFVVETTLSGSYINKVAQKAKEKGYVVKIIYIFLETPELCIERVKIRVIKGGHDVPIEDIVRRYYRSKLNFWDNFTKLADSWWLFYNGAEGFQQVALGTLEEYSIENPILFNLFKSIQK